MVKLSRYISEDENNVKQEELQVYNDNKTTVYTYVKNFIDLLEQELKVELANNENFVYGMVEYSRQAFHILKLLPRIKVPEKKHISI